MDGITESMDEFGQASEDGEWTGKLGVLQSMEFQRIRHDLETKQEQLYEYIRH